MWTKMLQGKAGQVVTLGACAALLAGSIAGCSGGSGDGKESETGEGGQSATPSPSSSAELRATWWGGDVLNAALQQSMQDCAVVADAKVLTEPQPWEGYWDKLATQAAGKNLPDVLMQAASQLPDYAGKGALLDLTSIPGIDFDQLDPGVRDYGNVDGETFAVVAATNASGVVANTEMLSEAGMPFPDGQYSWSDLKQYSIDLSDKLGEGKWALQDSAGDMILFILFVRDETGGEFYSDEGIFQPTSEQVEAWFQWWDDLRTAGAVPPADVTAEAAGDPGNSAIVKGNAAMGFMWTQDLTSFQGLMEPELDIYLPPFKDSNPSLWINAASLWSIAATSPSPENAAELINCLVNDPQAVETNGVALGIPPSQAARDLLQGKLSPADEKAVEYMSLVSEHSRPLNRLWPAGFAELRSYFEQTAQSVAFGKDSPQQAAELILTKAEELDAAL
ncbi:extracellular solute-binding protein [Actinomycetaceae bacterium MB13-C1-2]|nr:extracellular solute-binding protein [Actinomycetaceae bacterium MB13-C1-2]